MDLDANRALLAAALARIPGGDSAALQTVYRLTCAKLFGVCLRILGNQAEAEDVLQEIYLTVWRKAGDFDAARASPMTWLIAIARNRAIARLRPGTRVAIEHTEGVFGGEQLVLGKTAMVEGLAHRSRHAFSLIIARRIQLFMVPSGTLMRAASSS